MMNVQFYFMTYTRNIMVMGAVLAIASVGLMPLLTNDAFAYGYAYANTSMTYCGNSANYKTHVTQTTEGANVTTQIQVPSVVCGNSFVSGSVTVKDGDNNPCGFTISSSNGQHTKSCGSNFDVNNPTIFMSISLDYSNGYTVNYSQSDSNT